MTSISWRNIHLQAAAGAARAHVALGIDTAHRVDPFAALISSGILLMARPLDGAAGLYVPAQDNDPAGVLLNVRHPLSKLRYTAAHELAHHIRDAHTAVVDIETEWLGRTDAAASDRERFAEAFAAWFLMPPGLIRASAARLGLTSGTWDATATYRLAVDMGTSYLATANHLADAKFITRTAARALARIAPRSIKQAIGASDDLANPWQDVWLVNKQSTPDRIAPQPGDAMVLEVEAAPPTGFVWMPSSVPDGIHLARRSFQAHGNSAIGGGGTYEFVFTVGRSTSGDLRLELKRPWEPQARQALQFHVATVSPPAPGILDPRQLPTVA